jgi:hypothetical protein
LIKEKDNFVYYDLEKESLDIAHWINKASLDKKGELLTREAERIAELI